MPANFKTYEAQSRLLAAVLAAHPELKLNFKGEITTDPVLNALFRSSFPAVSSDLRVVGALTDLSGFFW